MRTTLPGTLLLGLATVLALASCGGSEESDTTAGAGDAGAGEEAGSGDAGGAEAGGGEDGDGGAGAGGGEDGDDTADGSEDGDGGGEGSEEDGDDPAGGGEEDGDGGEVSDADFTALMESRPEARASVVYEGEASGEELLRWYYAQDPPALTMGFADGSSEFRIIVPADGSGQVMCSAEDAAAWQCLRFPGEGPAGEMLPFGDMAGFMLADDPYGLDWAATSRDEIAGRDAVCASAALVLAMGGHLDGTTEVCVDPELGILLRFRSETDTGVVTRFEAVEVGEPSPDDFVPPAEPIDMGGFGDE